MAATSRSGSIRTATSGITASPSALPQAPRLKHPSRLLWRCSAPGWRDSTIVVEDSNRRRARNNPLVHGSLGPGKSRRQQTLPAAFLFLAEHSTTANGLLNCNRATFDKELRARYPASLRPFHDASRFVPARR